jgi:L-threonylcarbamoyladenylate synthase
MKTLRWTRETEAALIREASHTLTEGKLVAVPTETVYGLAARADSEEACRRIFAAKGRPSTHPLIVHIATIEAAKALVLPEAHETLVRWASRFWPGSLTLVLPRTHAVPRVVSAGGETVALRMPAHPVMSALLEACPFGLAAPSANRYQGVSPTTADHVARSLGDAVDLIIDGGPCAVGIESTIVAPAWSRALGHMQARVLRLGATAIDALRAFEHTLAVDVGFEEKDAIHEAPGRDRRHYAPSCTVAFVAGAEALNCPREGEGYLTYEEIPPEGYSFVRALPGDPDGYGRGLYSALHDAETSGIHTLYVRRTPDGDGWAAIRDRLTRAASR